MKALLATYAASNLLSGVASLLSVLVLARLLPPAQYGEYVTVLVVATLCQTAGFSWLNSSVIRLHAEETDEYGRARFAAAALIGFTLSAVVVVVIWAIGLAVLRLWSVDRTWLGVAGLSVLLSTSWASIGLAWNRVTARHRRFVAAQAIQALGGLALAIAGLAWRPGEPLVALAALAVASLLAASIARFPVRTALRERRQVRRRLRDIWTYGAPVTGASLGYTILASSDRLLIAASLGPTAAGAYAAASGIAGRALGLLLPPIAVAIRPQVFLEFSQRGAEPARQLMYRTSGWLIAIGLPVTVLFVCAPGPLASVILGNDLGVAAAQVLPWTAVGALMSVFLTMHFALAFQVARRTNWMLLAVAPAALLNILSNVVLLPTFGIVAAGWSIVASHAIALLLAIGFGDRHFRVPFAFSDAWRTVVACAPLVAFLQLEFPATISGFVLMLGGGALAYAVSAFALDVANVRSELMALLRKFRRGARREPKA
ncbi:MAG: lipopolysaccharide biosynthesis protein [Pseudomonadota bacterium]